MICWDQQKGKPKMSEQLLHDLSGQVHPDYLRMDPMVVFCGPHQHLSTAPRAKVTTQPPQQNSKSIL